MSALRFRDACVSDAPALADLVNRAYRPPSGTGGWTHEADLVDGARTSAAQVSALIGQGEQCLLLAHLGDQLAGCVHVERHGPSCHIGLLAVEPSLQVNGAGRQLLQAAEAVAVERYAARMLEMSVVTARTSLMAFYVRRGYAPEGELEPYPVDAGVGTPRGEPLRLQRLVKHVGT